MLYVFLSIFVFLFFYIYILGCCFSSGAKSFSSWFFFSSFFHSCDKLKCSALTTSFSETDNVFFSPSAFDDMLEWVEEQEASEQKLSSAREMTLGTSPKVSLQEKIRWWCGEGAAVEWKILPRWNEWLYVRILASSCTFDTENGQLVTRVADG